MNEPAFIVADITAPIKEESAQSTGPSQEEPAQSTGLTEEDLDIILIPLSKLQFTLVFISMGAAFLLAVIDGTVVSSALPRIIDDFGSPEKSPWIGSIFLLTRS
ncbi:hypothetical protein HDU98_011232 [Podochytrium sp. JEL0797]|nr:hypothetical protein HDU98_011232 [Podochytrium sp. JEL0797]